MHSCLSKRLVSIAGALAAFAATTFTIVPALAAPDAGVDPEPSSSSGSPATGTPDGGASPTSAPGVKGGSDSNDVPNVGGATAPASAGGSAAAPGEAIPALPDRTKATPPPEGPPPFEGEETYFHRNPAHYKDLETLREPGLVTTFPPFVDSIFADVGGWRSKLAEYNTGIESRSITSASGQFNDTGIPKNPQQYIGQRLTLTSHSSSITLTHRFDEVGLHDTKLILNVTYAINSFHEQVGPNQIVCGGCYLYQSVNDKMLEIKAGFLGAQNEFIGLFVGGSPVLSNGVLGVVPLAAGLTGPLGPTPALILTINSKSGLYLKQGLMRSTDPAGAPTEQKDHDGGFRFARTNAGPLYIGELGYRQKATAHDRSIWFRAGGMYNYSRYTRFADGTKQENAAVYGIIDYQLFHTSSKAAYRGLYGDVGYYWSLPQVNVFNQTYQLRLYGLGLFDFRPSDAITLDVSYKPISQIATDAFERRHIYANYNQFSVNAGYSAHVMPGVYIQPGLGYLTHPAITANANNALFGQIAAFFIL